MSLHYEYNEKTQQLFITGEGLVKGDDLYRLHLHIHESETIPHQFQYILDTRPIYNLDLWDSDATLLAFGDPFRHSKGRRILVSNDRIHAILKSYITALSRYSIKSRLIWSGRQNEAFSSTDLNAGPWRNQLPICA